MRQMILEAGIFKQLAMPHGDLVEWFRKNSDLAGNVNKEIVIFRDAMFKTAGDGAITWVMSDYSVDSDLERMDPTGWDLKNFKRNPVVLWSHEHMRPAIGKVESPKVKDGQLVGRVRFSSKEVDPFAAMIEGKVREGIINGGSVGFKTRKIEIVDDPKATEILIHRKQELFEFSIVNMPANTNAMATRSMKEYKEIFEALIAEVKESIKSQENLDLKFETWVRKQKKPSYIDSLLKQDRNETSGIKHLLRSGTKQT